MDEQHRVELGRAHLGGRERTLAQGQRALEVRGDELVRVRVRVGVGVGVRVRVRVRVRVNLLELGAAEAELEVLGP